MIKKILVLLMFFLVGCASVPEGIEPVSNFEVNKYLGQWYEVARLDHSFERGLDNVTATYSLKEDGSVRVLNRGYNTDDKAWEDAEGKAKFVGPTNIGSLKVSFFGPFYGGYNIFDLDPDYQYAMIAGGDRGYLWILSRTPTLDPAVRERLLEKAKGLNFPVDKLIFVDHSRAKK